MAQSVLLSWRRWTCFGQGERAGRWGVRVWV